MAKKEKPRDYRQAFMDGFVQMHEIEQRGVIMALTTLMMGCRKAREAQVLPEAQMPLLEVGSESEVAT